MPSLASSRELLGSYAFRVFIDSHASADFSKLSALEIETSVFEYREAGSALPIKDPDQISVQNITLETGASQNVEFYNWAMTVAQSVVGTKQGAPIQVDKRNLTVLQYDRTKTPVKKIHIYGAFPVHFVAGEWDNGSDSIVIERLMLAFDYFDIVTGTDSVQPIHNSTF